MKLLTKMKDRIHCQTQAHKTTNDGKRKKRNASEQVDFFQKISENIRPLKNKDCSNIITKLRYLDIWDDYPIKLYAMVEVKNVPTALGRP